MVNLDVGTAKPQERILSIDLFRGLTMLLMLFVNDIGDVDLGHIANAPSWLKHMPPDVDGMTMPDVIFPCFLFLVGLAIPIALERRIAAGDSLRKLAGHVLIRSAALIFIGVCMVNGCHGIPLNEAAMGMSGDCWRVLMFLGVFLFWMRYPNKTGVQRAVGVALRLMAAGLLAYLIVIYRADEQGASIWLRPRWYGIIGIIGWCYLICAWLWLLCRKNTVALMGAFGLLIALNIGNHLGLLGRWGELVQASHGWVPGIYYFSTSLIVVAGMTIATFFQPNSPLTTPRARIAWILLFAAGFAAAGLLLRPLGGICKNAGTCSWALCSLGVACTAYPLVYWLADVKRVTGWATPMVRAGSNTLFMYMLPQFFYSLLAVAGIDFLQTHFHSGWPGVARSAALAVFFVITTNWLTRRGFQLKL